MLLVCVCFIGPATRNLDFLVFDKKEDSMMADNWAFKFYFQSFTWRLFEATVFFLAGGNCIRGFLVAAF